MARFAKSGDKIANLATLFKKCFRLIDLPSSLPAHEAAHVLFREGPEVGGKGALEDGVEDAEEHQNGQVGCQERLLPRVRVREGERRESGHQDNVGNLWIKKMYVINHY